MKVLKYIGLILAAVIISACDISSTIDNNVDKAIKAIDRAIASLETESNNWQNTLVKLEDELASDTQSTIRQEVNNILNRAVATTGSEFRCNVDFVGYRVKDHLIRLRAELLRHEIPPILPNFCSISPEAVDLRLSQERLNIISVYGYDLDINKPIKAMLVDTDGQSIDISNTVNYPTHYLMTLTLSGSTGINFTDKSKNISFRWKHNNEEFASIGIIQKEKSIPLKVFTKTSSPAQHPSVAVNVPGDFKLVGGGCRSDWGGVGQLLTASYPDIENNSWICRAKDHHTAEVASVTGFAVAVPRSFGLEIISVNSTGATAAHPTASVRLPQGYHVISGGCLDNWSGFGNLLVDSAPTPDGWECRGKDHLVSAPSSITAYALGAKESDYEIVVKSSSGSKVAHPKAEAKLPEGFALIGGGCDISQSEPGNMLYATMPIWDNSTWACGGKDHIHSSPSSIKAYAIGIKPKF